MSSKTIAGISEAEIRTRHNEEIQELRRRISQYERILGEYKQSHGSIRALTAELKNSIHIIQPPGRVFKRDVVQSKRVDSPVTACIQISDVHYGAVQEASEVEGFGVYSPEIAEARSMEFVAKVARWTSLHRSNYKIERVAVLVTGDLISGDIHQELSVTNAFPVPVQVIGAARLLARQISELSKYFRLVTVHFITEDNHARITLKPQAKEAGLNSFNYLVGEFAKQALARHDNVVFNIYPRYENIVQVETRRYLIMHGHNVKGWMGFPYYGVERRLAREAMKRMNAPDNVKFHKVVMGHWHSPLSHSWYWIGGSLQGTDAYDHKNGRHAEPSQAAWFVHPKWGEFDRTDFVFSRGGVKP